MVSAILPLALLLCFSMMSVDTTYWHLFVEALAFTMPWPVTALDF